MVSQGDEYEGIQKPPSSTCQSKNANKHEMML